MGDRKLNDTLDELWSDFFNPDEREMVEQVNMTRWKLIENPHHKLAFLYAASDALTRLQKEHREDQRVKYGMDRLEGLAMRIEGERLAQKDRHFSEYMTFERERQSQMVGLAHEWMDRQEVLQRYGIDRQEQLDKASKVEVHQLPSDQKSLPPTSHYHSVGDCFLGPIGPTGVVLSVIRDDGEYVKCRLVDEADRRSVLRWQFINAPRRAEAGCPLPDSRNIMPRALPIWPPLKHKTCDLADGTWKKRSELPGYKG